MKAWERVGRNLKDLHWQARFSGQVGRVLEIFVSAKEDFRFCSEWGEAHERFSSRNPLQ